MLAPAHGQTPYRQKGEGKDGEFSQGRPGAGAGGREGAGEREREEGREEGGYHH